MVRWEIPSTSFSCFFPCASSALFIVSDTICTMIYVLSSKVSGIIGHLLAPRLA